jgi:glycosyltransferase involved in cell wall biosynthesis
MHVTVADNAKLRRIPVVLQAHGSVSRDVGNRALKRSFDGLFGTRILAATRKAIALNEAEASLYLDMGLSRNDIAVLPNAIDTESTAFFADTPLAKARVLVPADARVVLYLGRVHSSKRIDLLVKAFKIVSDVEDEIYLVIAGPDDGYMGKLRRLVRNYSLESKTLITGFIEPERKVALLKRSNVLVLPSFSGFPITLLEACSVGTPIITTTLADDLHWIQNRVGLVVDANEYSLASGIQEVVGGRDKSALFKRNGPRLVEERFTWKTVLGQYLATYSECINSSQAGLTPRG